MLIKELLNSTEEPKTETWAGAETKTETERNITESGEGEGYIESNGEGKGKRSTDSNGSEFRSEEFRGLHHYVLERPDLLRLLLRFLDLSALTGLYVAAGRRMWKDFCAAITTLHTGYYCVSRPRVTNEEFFPQLFNSQRAFSPVVLNQLRTIVMFARELPRDVPRCPLSFKTVLQLKAAFCRACEDQAVIFSGLDNLALEQADDPNTSLVKKINLSKQMQMQLRSRFIAGSVSNIRFMLMDSPFTCVGEGESALDVLRLTCPLLERLDLIMSLSLDDFKLFIDPTTVWPSLKELEIGKLIQAFRQKLELDDYFDSNFSDTDELVFRSVTSVLTAEKFPKLKTLEVWAPDAQSLFSTFEAIVNNWVENAINPPRGTFVGHQLTKLLLIEDPNPATDKFVVAQAWANLFLSDRRFSRLSDPQLSKFCLFPHLQCVSFLPDLPSPYFMLLINSAVGLDSIPSSLDLQVKGSHRRQLADFLENFHQEDRWRISKLDLCPLRTNCSTSFRRYFMGSRRNFCQFRSLNIATGQEVEHVVPEDASDVEYAMSLYWRDFDYAEEASYLLEQSATALVKAIAWSKLYRVSDLTMDLTTITAIMNCETVCQLQLCESLASLERLCICFNEMFVSAANEQALLLFLGMIVDLLMCDSTKAPLAQIHWRVFTLPCWKYIHSYGFSSSSAARQLKEFETQLYMTAQYDTEVVPFNFSA